MIVTVRSTVFQKAQHQPISYSLYGINNMEVIYVSNGRTVDYYFNSLYRRRCFYPHKSLDSLGICLRRSVFSRLLDIFSGRYH